MNLEQDVIEDHLSYGESVDVDGKCIHVKSEQGIDNVAERGSGMEPTAGTGYVLIKQETDDHPYEAADPADDNDQESVSAKLFKEMADTSQRHPTDDNVDEFIPSDEFSTRRSSARVNKLLTRRNRSSKRPRKVNQQVNTRRESRKDVNSTETGPIGGDEQSKESRLLKRKTAKRKKHNTDLCDGESRNEVDGVDLSREPKQSMKLSKSTSKENLQCDTCKKTFSNPYKLSRHRSTHTGSKIHMCRFCGIKFAQVTTMNQHERIHTGERPYACTLCPKAFMQKSGLDYHMRSHTGDKPFSCDICERKFASKAALDYHRGTHSVDGAPPRSHAKKPCPTCGKDINTSQMARHLRVHNKDSPRYKCETCDKSFKYKPSLEVHKRLHSGVRPYSCRHCEKTFVRYINHVEHERTHTGEKPYVCKYCDHSFAQMSTLKRHEWIHTDSKPYNCKLCGKTFRQPAGLNSHRKTCSIIRIVIPEGMQLQVQLDNGANQEGFSDGGGTPGDVRVDGTHDSDVDEGQVQGNVEVEELVITHHDVNDPDPLTADADKDDTQGVDGSEEETHGSVVNGDIQADGSEAVA